MVHNRFKSLIKTRPRAIFWALALAGSVIAVSANPVSDFDIWWHLKTGEVISAWQSIPTYDIFSYTAAGAPWVNHEWLFEVLAFQLFYNFGIASLIFLKMLLTAIFTYLIFRTFKLLTESPSAALFGALIVLWASADRILERPHLFSMVFAAAYLLILHGQAAGRQKTLWLLPVIQIVWANIHGGAVLGPMIVFAFAIGESLQAAVRHFTSGDTIFPFGPNVRRRLWLIGFACVAASMLNPSGIDIFLFSASHLKMDVILAYTQEWLPVLDPRIDAIVPMLIFRVALVITLVSYILNRRNVRISHIFLTVISSMLILKGKRFTPEFMIFNTPIVFYNLRGIARRIPVTPGLGYLHSWGNLFLAFAVSILVLRHGIPVTMQGHMLDDIGLGISEDHVPTRMIDFLDDNNIHGFVFNDMGLGGYLIFRRWPADLVFLDGRTPVYGDDFYKQFLDAFHTSKNFVELDRRYNFDYLIFRGDSAWNLRYFHKYLWDTKVWRLVYANNLDGLVYLRDAPQFRDVIKKFALKKHPLVEEMENEKKAGSVRNLF